MMAEGGKKEKPRDPRFEGAEKVEGWSDFQINKGLFEASYKFVDDMARQRERGMEMVIIFRYQNEAKEQCMDLENGFLGWEMSRWMGMGWDGMWVNEFDRRKR